MPRIIGENIKNQLLIPDKFAGGFCTVFYRPGTTEERIAYPSAQWERKDGKIRNRRREALLDYGEMVILGFEEGYFKFKTPSPLGGEPSSTSPSPLGGEGRGEGELRTISSDPESKNYDPNWKALLRKYAPDILEAVAEHVFEPPVAVAWQGEEYTEKN